jgi:hypothetical protein
VNDYDSKTAQILGFAMFAAACSVTFWVIVAIFRFFV